MIAPSTDRFASSSPDLWASALHANPFMPEVWRIATVQQRDLIQSFVRETARYSLNQAGLAAAACRDFLGARDFAAIAATEFKFIEQSYQLALESGERMTAMTARQDAERLNALPIE